MFLFAFGYGNGSWLLFKLSTKCRVSRREETSLRCHRSAWETCAFGIPISTSDFIKQLNDWLCYVSALVFILGSCLKKKTELPTNPCPSLFRCGRMTPQAKCVEPVCWEQLADKHFRQSLNGHHCWGLCCPRNAVRQPLKTNSKFLCCKSCWWSLN